MTVLKDKWQVEEARGHHLLTVHRGLVASRNSRAVDDPERDFN